MKKQEKNQLAKISRNLDKVFNLATDKQIKEGKNWYYKANEEINKAANLTQFAPIVAANVCSILSPRNKWAQNLKDMLTVLNAVNKGVEPEDVKVCTFHTNKFKAFNAAKEELIVTDKSLKTYNFVRNIGLLCKDSVTIDIWALRACFYGTPIKIDSASIGRIAYGQIKDLFLKKAAKLGLTGYEYQAILWVTLQENYISEAKKK
jgi:hypothetical protein